MNISNKKTILLLSISTLMINGCISKHERITMLPQRVMVPSTIVQAQNSWPIFEEPVVMEPINTKKKDCVDCYAAPIYSSKPSVSKRSFAKRVVTKPFKISSNSYSSPIDYSVDPTVVKRSFSKRAIRPVSHAYTKKEIMNTKHYGSYAYTEKASDRIAKIDNYANTNANRYVLPVVAPIGNSYNSYSTLSNNSDVSVQIGAFRDYSGAKRYMRRYSALSSKYQVVLQQGVQENQPIYRVQIKGFENDMIAKRFMDSYGIQGAFLVRR